MDFERLEYLVGDLAVAPQRLTIDPQGLARYESHTNWATLDVPEMGVYQAMLPADRVRQLSSTLATPPFQGLADHWGKVRPGDRTQRIRITSGGNTAEKLAGTTNPVDPGLAHVIGLLDQIAAEVKRHSRQVLRLELGQSRLNDSSLSCTIVLASAGVEPVVFRNPVDLVPPANGSLTVALWPDKPAVELRPEDQLTLVAASVRQIQPASPLPVDVLTLPPNASAEFVVEFPLPSAQPGPMNLRLSYANYAARVGDHEVLLGELVSRTTSTIVPPAPPATAPIKR